MKTFLLHNFLLLVFVLGFASAGARADEASAIREIQALLNVDRFLYYRDSWLAEFGGRKNPELVKALQAITVDEVYSRSKEFAVQLSDVMQYDALLVEFASAHSPGQKIDPAVIAWNYNFYKRKVQESFVLNLERADSRGLPGLLTQSPAATRGSRELPLTWAPDSKILLDTDQYISNRTTRAVFWDAALSGRKIEFHLGTERAFRTRLQSNQARIIGEVKPVARNYNKIYLVQYPGQPEPVYAFTRISGRDRLDHLIKQLPLVKIKGRTANEQKSVRIFGDETRISRQIENSVTKLLERLPEADLVIIGQKGAIESHLRSGYLLEALIELRKTHEASVKAQLSEKDWKGFVKLTDGLDAQSELLTDLKRITSTDRYATLLKAELAGLLGIQAGQEKIFDVEIVSHDISDYLLKSNSGANRRWRIISNVWGDEVLPIAKALARTGHKRVISIGTAGAITGKGFEVGDLVRAQSVYNETAKKVEPMPGTVFQVAGAKLATVGHVTTPYVETENWLAGSTQNFDVIELETAYLHEVFKTRVNYQSFLLISDIVGSEHESLAVANSDGRKRSLLNLLKAVATQEGVTRVVPAVNAERAHEMRFKELAALQRRVDELAPKRSLESRVQITQAAWHAGLVSDEQITGLIKEEKPFSREILNRSLTSAGHFVSLLNEAFAERGKSSRLYLPPEFMQTRWNPARGLDLLLQVDSESDVSLANEMIRKLFAQNPTLKKSVRAQVTAREPDWKWLPGILAGPDSSHALTDLYANLILRQAGVVSTVNTSGQMRYERISELRTEVPKKNIDSMARAPLCRAAFAQ